MVNEVKKSLEVVEANNSHKEDETIKDLKDLI